MRIALIINKFGIGGAERLALDELAEFRRRGIDVQVITLRPSNADESFAIDGLHTIPFRSLLDVPAWYRLVRFLRQGRFDVMLTHLWLANTIGRIAAKLAGVPRVCSFEHNVYDRVKTRKQFFADRILQGWCTRIIAVSGAVRNSLVAHGIDEKKITVIPNGIDLERFRSSGVRESAGEFTFLFVGRLVEQKGVDVLLDALAQVERGQLHIAGSGILRASLEQKAKDLGIESRVEFLGARSDVPHLLKQVDCFVFPSRWEGYGLTLLEAAAAGLPIIASNLPAVRDIVSNGAEALLVAPEDVGALAKAMQTMMDDPALRARLAAAGRRKATEFSVEKHVDRLLELIV